MTRHMRGRYRRMKEWRLRGPSDAHSWKLQPKRRTTLNFCSLILSGHCGIHDRRKRAGYQVRRDRWRRRRSRSIRNVSFYEGHLFRRFRLPFLSFSPYLILMIPYLLQRSVGQLSHSCYICSNLIHSLGLFV